ncbi:MAG: hypothetical protein QOE97_1956 [Pseudonocardiales bacterium]|jgi:hypothetical protein|nr:hypothetical protein [Pseudonocardiales bacterium]
MTRPVVIDEPRLARECALEHQDVWLDTGRYTSEAFLALWMRVWQPACRETIYPKRGRGVNGALARVQDREVLNGLDDSAYALPEIGCGTCAGFVLINPMLEERRARRLRRIWNRSRSS